jgi:hypothetical protein
MRKSTTRPARALLALLSLALLAAPAQADEKKTFSVGEGYLTFEVPEGWKVVRPRVRIIEHEFAVPAAEGDKRNGRVTVMGAGGTVRANLDRWIGQFVQPDGGNTKERAKVEKKTIAGQEVHLVDLSGTYLDKPAPFLPKAIKRPHYRMLAAIIMTEGKGNYFVKFYGPEKTVGQNAKAFREMIESLRTK